VIIPIILGSLLSGLFIIAYNQYKSSSIDKSFHRAVQQELQKARDDLDLTLAYRDQNIRRLVVFDLVFKDQVPSRFSGNRTLCADVQFLYDSMNSAKKSAERLFDLLAKEDADREAISNHESAIRRAIKSADEIGPRIEQFTGSKWQIPSSDLSSKEKMAYLEKVLITSAATDAQVKVKSMSPLSK